MRQNVSETLNKIFVVNNDIPVRAAAAAAADGACRSINKIDSSLVPERPGEGKKRKD